MRIIVLFDLPTVTKAERRAYTLFRRFLINDGYDMIQFSIYGRVVGKRPVCTVLTAWRDIS